MAQLGLELEVRRMENLYRAFTVVRSNINASGRAEFRAKIQEVSKNPVPYLKRIQGDLQKRKFVFEPQQGVPQVKASGKTRPLVVSPVRNRIVQRAILERSTERESSG